VLWGRIAKMNIIPGAAIRRNGIGLKNQHYGMRLKATVDSYLLVCALFITFRGLMMDLKSHWMFEVLHIFVS